MSFQYKTVRLKTKIFGTAEANEEIQTQQLNQWGAKGWELVNVINNMSGEYWAYFKKQR